MITLYYWPTPNGHKVSIMLEECGLPYKVKPIDILNGEQFDPDFIAISPNNRIPALTDTDGPGTATISLFESGAILTYLAEKTGRFLPGDAAGRCDVMQWLFFQVGHIGPMFGQCGHFLGYAPEKIPYAIERYQKETLRLYGVLDRRLSDREFVSGDYSIADIAIYPWIHVRWFHDIDIDAFPHVKAWYHRLSERPGVATGCALMAEDMQIGNPTEEARTNLFGAAQFDGKRGASDA